MCTTNPRAWSWYFRIPPSSCSLKLEPARRVLKAYPSKIMGHAVEESCGKNATRCRMMCVYLSTSEAILVVGIRGAMCTRESDVAHRSADRCSKAKNDQDCSVQSYMATAGEVRERSMAAYMSILVVPFLPFSPNTLPSQREIFLCFFFFPFESLVGSKLYMLQIRRVGHARMFLC